MPGTQDYTERFTQRELLQLIRDGTYEVRRDGTILRGGKVIKPWTRKRSGSEITDLCVTIAVKPKRSSVTVSRLVWMKFADSTIPRGWEIHHDDEDTWNCRFDNLFCLHPSDHRKAHGRWQEEVPF